MKVNQTLTSVNLGGNQIGAAGAHSLAEALKVNQTLTSVNLGGNQIGAAGAHSSAEALKVNQTLTRVDLRVNQLGDAGAKKIDKLITRNKRLCDQLHQAIKSNELARVQALITQGVSLLAPSENEGNTALHWAVLSHSQVMVNYLLAKMKARHFPLTIRNRTGKTAQELAQDKNEILVLFNSSFEEVNKLPNLVEKDNKKSYKSELLVSIKIQKAATEQFKNEYVFGDSTKARAYFKEHSHLIDADYDNGYFLVKAAEQNDEELLGALLNKKPASDLSDALAVARRDGYEGCVKLLLDYA